MSLDVTLIQTTVTVKQQVTGIFVRENGKTVELTIEEAKKKYPDYKPNPDAGFYATNVVYEDNITHNLGAMAKEAGIYEHLWRPEEINITKASELIDPLREGLHRLKLEPERFKAFNPSNGWGSYETLVAFVSDYLDACYKYPEATVEVDR
jgi:hypothetical protein